VNEIDYLTQDCADVVRDYQWLRVSTKAERDDLCGRLKTQVEDLNSGLNKIESLGSTNKLLTTENDRLKESLEVTKRLLSVTSWTLADAVHKTKRLQKKLNTPISETGENGLPKSDPGSPSNVCESEKQRLTAIAIEKHRIEKCEKKKAECKLKARTVGWDWHSEPNKKNKEIFEYLVRSQKSAQKRLDKLVGEKRSLQYEATEHPTKLVETRQCQPNPQNVNRMQAPTSNSAGSDTTNYTDTNADNDRNKVASVSTTLPSYQDGVVHQPQGNLVTPRSDFMTNDASTMQPAQSQHNVNENKTLNRDKQIKQMTADIEKKNTELSELRRELTNKDEAIRTGSNRKKRDERHAVVRQIERLSKDIANLEKHLASLELLKKSDQKRKEKLEA